MIKRKKIGHRERRKEKRDVCERKNGKSGKVKKNFKMEEKWKDVRANYLDFYGKIQIEC